MYLLTQHVAELNISSNSTFECKILLWVTYGQLRCLLFRLQINFFFSKQWGKESINWYQCDPRMRFPKRPINGTVAKLWSKNKLFLSVLPAKNFRTLRRCAKEEEVKEGR